MHDVLYCSFQRFSRSQLHDFATNLTLIISLKLSLISGDWFDLGIFRSIRCSTPPTNRFTSSNVCRVSRHYDSQARAIIVSEPDLLQLFDQVHPLHIEQAKSDEIQGEDPWTYDREEVNGIEAQLWGSAWSPDRPVGGSMSVYQKP